MGEAVRAESLSIHRRRPRGVSVRSGAVRQARFEAGLTLAAVAGKDLTRAAIHLIEVGKSRPSMSTLRLIAKRTGKPVTYFLDEAALAEGSRPLGNDAVGTVEALVEKREYEAAIAAAVELVDQLVEESDAGRLHLAVTVAHLKLRQVESAMEHVRPALEAFEAIGDEWMVVECLDWQAFGFHMQHDPRAVELTQSALQRCQALDPIPARTEARILNHLAVIHLQRADWELALKFLEAALDASSALRDFERIAAINHDLAAALAHVGRHSESLSRGYRALDLYRTLRDVAGMASLENDLGVTKTLQGDFAGAYGHLMNSLGHYGDAGIERAKSHTLLSLAELHMARGSDYEAESSCHDAIELAERMGEQRSFALAHQYLGQIAARRGETARADAEFEQAIGILEANDASQRLIDCRMAYADVLEQRGDLAGANRQLRTALGRVDDRPGLSRTASA